MSFGILKSSVLSHDLAGWMKGVGMTFLPLTCSTVCVSSFLASYRVSCFLTACGPLPKLETLCLLVVFVVFLVLFAFVVFVVFVAFVVFVVFVVLVVFVKSRRFSFFTGLSKLEPNFIRVLVKKLRFQPKKLFGRSLAETIPKRKGALTAGPSH